MGISGGPYIVRDSSLVLELDAADKNSYPNSGTNWYDVSGNGYNATMSGSLIYNGSFPNSFQYITGSNNYFLGNNSLTGSIITGVTIMSWIKMNDISTRGVVLNKYISSAPNGYSLEAGTLSTANTLRFYAKGTGASATAYTGAANSITQNTIFLASATFDYNTKITALFVNDTQISGTEGSTPATISSDWYTGAPVYSLGSFRPNLAIDGAMTQYNLMLYNRALSLSEIQQNYNAQKSRFGL